MWRLRLGSAIHYPQREYVVKKGFVTSLLSPHLSREMNRKIKKRLGKTVWLGNQNRDNDGKTSSGYNNTVFQIPVLVSKLEFST